jgi:pimeloyl-ACP methyl ester carboxylesterase
MNNNIRPTRLLNLTLAVCVCMGIAACSRTTPPAPTQAQPSATKAPASLPATLAPTSTQAASATATIPAGPSATATTQPAVFTSAPCPMKLPDSLQEGRSIECGYVTVPEDRQDPNGRQIELAVAILRNLAGKSEADPIIYLEGGPGGSPLKFLYLNFEDNFKPYFASGRDIILFDQRGVGYSKPALDCTEHQKLYYELLDNEKDGKKLSKEQMTLLDAQSLIACAQELSSKANLKDYNSAANAADVNDLRKALGYEKVNLWGISYGTRLALEVMRDFPEGVRSVILDSTYTPDVDLYSSQPANMERSFGTLFAACAADAACNKAYPDLHKVFFDTVKRLNEKEAELQVTDPLANKKYSVALTGDNLVSMLFQFLYDSTVIPSLPKIIYDASQGKYDLLGLLTGSIIASQSDLSDGMYFAVQCYEEVPFGTLDAIKAEAARFPELSSYFDDSSLRENFDVCRAWNLGQAGAEANQPVSSQIPTLVMAGEFDPVTPPAWGKQAASTLANAHFYQYPGLGHGTSTQEGCPRDMALAFFKDPSQAPDSACIAQMHEPIFAVPGALGVELIPYKIAAARVQGLVPKGWEETSPGIFMRNSSKLDQTVVLIQVAPVSGDVLLNAYTQQLGLQTPPKSSGEHKAGKLTWTLYEFEVGGLPVKMAIAESNILSFMVLMQTFKDEQAALYDSVFLPMVDALRPAQ